ncbi:spore coat protein JB [Fictibacillus solisalsi]|uniref:Spore coat protein JB n=1 Tax=Fictibacillus solisalsi TaxID=459525 RepID=A0A1H0AST5_9BACL|nr:spore coat protein CotJB [Fictibacillus solisalsi]SDN36580.1 spore coat protein JB [Fictibacillus solisalsi]
MPKTLPKEYYSMLEEIQAVDFAITELNLYLDTHPEDQEAFKQLTELSEEKQRLLKPFEQKFGSIRPDGIDDHWTWSKGPWPWQV